MNARDHMLGSIALVAGSDTGRRGQGAAGPAYPGLAQRWQWAGFDMPAHFHFGLAEPGGFIAHGPSWGSLAVNV